MISQLGIVPYVLDFGIELSGQAVVYTKFPKQTRHPSLEEEGKMRFIKISQAKHKKESISILLISTSIGTCKKLKSVNKPPNLHL